MLYVHVAEAHAREWPDPVHEAARVEIDPDRRIIAMLGARVRVKPGTETDGRGKTVAKLRRRNQKRSSQRDLDSEGRRTRTFNQRIKSPMLYH